MFKFTAPATGEYTFSSAGLGAGLRYLDGYLYDGSKKQVASKNSAAKKPFEFKCNLTRGRTYYLKADGFYGTGAYTLNVAAPGKSDDYGDSFDEAHHWVVAPGQANSLTGVIEQSKDADMFMFIAPATGSYTFSVTEKGAGLQYFDGYLYNGIKALVVKKLSKSNESITFTSNLTGGQTYYWKADGYYGTGSYTLSILAPSRIEP
jgi:hypothetical protein